MGNLFPLIDRYCRFSNQPCCALSAIFTMRIDSFFQSGSSKKVKPEELKQDWSYQFGKEKGIKVSPEEQNSFLKTLTTFLISMPKTKQTEEINKLDKSEKITFHCHVQALLLKDSTNKRLQDLSETAQEIFISLTGLSI